LGFPVVSGIASQPSLKLQSEESLFDFVLSRVSQDSNYFTLFEFIRFEYLSTESICQFADLISKSFDFLTPSIWEQLRNRLVLPVKLGSGSDRVRDCISCVFREGSPLEGIICHLTSKVNGNVHDHAVKMQRMQLI
jgi:hypothetical protein